MERGRLYDGKQAQPREVLLDIATLDLRLLNPDDHVTLKTWAWADMTVLSAPVGGLRGTLSHKVETDCRLVVADDVWNTSIAPYLKSVQLSPRAPFVVVLCVASLAFIVAMMFASPFLLDLAAPFVPFPLEDTLGSYAAAEMTGGKTCKGTSLAQNSLSRLTKELGDGDQTFNVSVADVSEVNAISLPGRRIVIFRGLLDHVTAPEQLAGVLAHEVGHHHYHHPIRIFLQNAGGELFLSLALGNAAVMSQAAGVARELLLLKGSRAYEQQADAYAVTALARNNMDTHGLTTFLDILGKVAPEGDAMPQWMNSHPVTSARIAALNGQIKALKNDGPTKPAFSPAEWTAIRNYCKH